MGILAVCGNIISTLTAHFSGYKYDDIKNGLYGFNGTLVGIAVGVFLQLSVGSLIMLIIASALSTWIAYFFNQQRLIPGFTAPFILAVWGMLGVCLNSNVSSGNLSRIASAAYFGYPSPK